MEPLLCRGRGRGLVVPDAADRDDARRFEPGWIAFILLRNAGLILAFFGAFHLRLYVRRAQGNVFKYNADGSMPTTRLSCSATRPSTT